MSAPTPPPASSLPGGASVADYFKGAPSRYRHMGTPFYAALADATITTLDREALVTADGARLTLTYRSANR